VCFHCLASNVNCLPLLHIEYSDSHFVWVNPISYYSGSVQYIAICYPISWSSMVRTLLYWSPPLSYWAAGLHHMSLLQWRIRSSGTPDISLPNTCPYLAGDVHHLQISSNPRHLWSYVEQIGPVTCPPLP